MRNAVRLLGGSLQLLVGCGALYLAAVWERSRDSGPGVDVLMVSLLGGVGLALLATSASTLPFSDQHYLRWSALLCVLGSATVVFARMT